MRKGNFVSNSGQDFNDELLIPDYEKGLYNSIDSENHQEYDCFTPKVKKSSNRSDNKKSK